MNALECMDGRVKMTNSKFMANKKKWILSGYKSLQVENYKVVSNY